MRNVRHPEKQRQSGTERLGPGRTLDQGQKQSPAVTRVGTSSCSSVLPRPLCAESGSRCSLSHTHVQAPQYFKICVDLSVSFTVIHLRQSLANMILKLTETGSSLLSPVGRYPRFSGRKRGGMLRGVSGAPSIGAGGGGLSLKRGWQWWLAVRHGRPSALEAVRRSRGGRAPSRQSPPGSSCRALHSARLTWARTQHAGAPATSDTRLMTSAAGSTAPSCAS